MKKVVLELSGIFIFLIGFGFMINSFSGITGYIISKQFSAEVSSLFGITLIVGGFMLFITGQHQRESKLIVNEKKGIRKIKFAIATKRINYNKLKKITKETGYKFVEGKDYAAVFSLKDKIIKNSYGYPIVIPYDKKYDKKLLIEILCAIVEDYEKV